MPFKNPNFEKLLFLKKALFRPMQIGAIFPSSAALARKVVQQALSYISKEDDFILELGPGTGSFTKELIKQNFPTKQWIGLELDPDLSVYLKKTFQEGNVIEGSALHTDVVVPKEYHGKIGCVLSGLPLRNMSQLAKAKIIEGCLKLLKPKGVIVQFTYGYRSPFCADLFNLKEKKAGHVFFNIPPATIFVYEKKDQDEEGLI